MAGDRRDYAQWLSEQHCCACGAPPPSAVHHSTGAGMGLRSSDLEAMPLCERCHRAFHDGNGGFLGWTKDGRRRWQRMQVARHLRGWVAPRALPDLEAEAVLARVDELLLV